MPERFDEVKILDEQLVQHVRSQCKCSDQQIKQLERLKQEQLSLINIEVLDCLLTQDISQCLRDRVWDSISQKTPGKISDEQWKMYKEA